MFTRVYTVKRIQYQLEWNQMWTRAIIIKCPLWVHNTVQVQKPEGVYLLCIHNCEISLENLGNYPDSNIVYSNLQMFCSCFSLVLKRDGVRIFCFCIDWMVGIWAYHVNLQAITTPVRATLCANFIGLYISVPKQDTQWKTFSQGYLNYSDYKILNKSKDNSLIVNLNPSDRPFIWEELSFLVF